MKLRLPERKKAFIIQTESLGELYSFKANIADLTEISKRLDKSIVDASPEEFVRVLISVTCHPRDKIIEGSFCPSGYSLSLEDVAVIKPDELEIFASHYIKDNEYLYRKKIDKHEPARDGKGIILSFEYGEIEHVRADNESNVSYLYRLWTLYEVKTSKRLRDATKPMISAYNSLLKSAQGFSSSLQEEIDRTLKMGNVLKNSLRSTQLPEMQKSVPFDPINLRPDYSEILKESEESRLRPFRNISDRLDKLIDVSANTAGFVVQMNKTQTDVANELKRAGDMTSFYSKWNLRLNIFIIALSIFSICISAYSIYYASNSSKQQLQYVGVSVEKLNTHLEAIDNNATSSSKTSQTQINKLIELQGLTIDELKKMNQQDHP